MREIKFRVWDEIDNEMKEIALLKWDDGQTLSRVAGWHSPKPGVGFRQAWTDAEPPYRYKVMQFTGLLDKNGTEIFEGDIVNYFISNFCRIGTIIYHEAAFAVSLKDGMGIELNTGKDIEVVGDIYQTPDLLKKAKE